jgi:hypothetical protein
MTRPTSIVGLMHVAPWDWPALDWSLPAWLEVCDRVILSWPYLQGGVPSLDALAWTGGGGVEIYAHRYELEEGLTKADRARVTFCALPQPKAFTAAERENWFRLIEAPRRNLLSYLPPVGSLLVTPDCDEHPRNPAALRAELERVHMQESLCLRSPIVDVLGLLPDGRRVLVVAEPREARNIAVTRPGCYTASRSTNLTPRDLRAELVHLRGLERGPCAAAHHDRYLGAGFTDWLAGLEERDRPKPGAWGPDARNWRRFEAMDVAGLGVAVPLELRRLGGGR